MGFIKTHASGIAQDIASLQNWHPVVDIFVELAHNTDSVSNPIAGTGGPVVVPTLHVEMDLRSRCDSGAWMMTLTKPDGIVYLRVDDKDYRFL